MIYPLHLAATFAGESRAAEDNAYKTQVGLVNAWLEDRIHLISEGTANGVTTYRAYPDPNYFGAAQPNEVSAFFAPYGEFDTATSRSDTVKLFDDGASNFIFFTLQTNGLINTISWGVNGTQANALSIPTPIITQGRIFLTLGATDGLAYINAPEKLPGFAYSFTLPAEWHYGRYTAAWEAGQNSLLQSLGMRTALYNWGQAGWASGGVKPLFKEISNVGVGNKPGNNQVQARYGSVAWADFGGSSDAFKHDNFLDAAPFGFYSGSIDNHLSAIDAPQTTASFSGNSYNHTYTLTEGSLETSLTAAGNAKNLFTGNNPGFTLTSSYGNVGSPEPEIYYSVDKLYADQYLAETGIDLVQLRIDAYYAEPPPQPNDFGPHIARWATSGTSTLQNSGQYVQALLDVAGSFSPVSFEFSEGVVVDALSAGASRLQETQQNMLNAYYSEEFSANESFCFFRVAFDPGSDTTTGVVEFWRRRLDTEPVIEDLIINNQNYGPQYRLYVREFEFVSESTSIGTTENPVIFFTSGAKTVAQARQGASFTSSFGTIELP